MLLVWRMRQDIELLKTRALVQATLFTGLQEPSQQDAKDLNEAWDGYTGELFPFQRGRVKKQDDAAITYLKSEVRRGPLQVKPLQYLGTARSRLHKRSTGQRVNEKLRGQK